MVDATAILPEDRVVIRAGIQSRKAALHALAEILSTGTNRLGYREIFFALEEREQQASTVLDELPIAIPHCRLTQCEETLAALMLVRGEGVLFGHNRVQLFYATCVPDSDARTAALFLQSIVKILSINDNVTDLLTQVDALALHRVFHTQLNSLKSA